MAIELAAADRLLLDKLVRRSMGLAALLATAAIGFSFAAIDGAVVAPGIVKVDLNRRPIQHREGGIVKTVRVRDGQRVAAGQILVELDDVGVDASAALLRQQALAERMRMVRLTAEKDFAPGFDPPAGLRPDDPAVADVLNRERNLFAARRQRLAEQLALLATESAEAAREAGFLEAQLAAERKAMALQQEELAANEALVAQRFIARSRILTLQRAVAEYQVRYQEHQAELAKSRQKIAELALRAASLKNDYLETAAKDLRESTAQVQDIEQRLRPSEDAAKRQNIVAPEAGEVMDLRIASPGTVIGPRDVLMEIVPSAGRLLIEGRIRPQDIAHVRANALADVRLTAFRYRDTPVVPARVVYVAADAIADQAGGAPYFAALVEIESAALKAAGNLYLSAGMPAELFIRTDKTTIGRYLLEPVTAYLRRAMRDA